MHLPTTNGAHCAGDGLKMTMAVGGGCVDLEWTQAHPAGPVHPKGLGTKVKFLSAGGLRGVGGVPFDMSGRRFCNEPGRRDYAIGMTWKTQGITLGDATGVFLCFNGEASMGITRHCERYEDPEGEIRTTLRLFDDDETVSIPFKIPRRAAMRRKMTDDGDRGMGLPHEVPSPD